jgi:hypothetical protein
MSFAMYTTKTDQANEALNEVPELCKNPLATFPMSQEFWVSPDKDIPNIKGVDTPAFIAAESPTAKRRTNYVYGPGPNGKGYYHIQTRVSYQILRQRLKQQTEGTTCCGGTEYEINSPKIRERLAAALVIVERRAKSSIPTEAPPVDNRVAQMVTDAGSGGSNAFLGVGLAASMCI